VIRLLSLFQIETMAQELASTESRASGFGFKRIRASAPAAVDGGGLTMIMGNSPDLLGFRG
jgi:hypothetical protein